MSKLRRIMLLLIIFCAVSCTSPLNSDEYLKWIESEENGMFGEKKIGDLQYKILYKPHNYVALKAMVKRKNSSIDSLKNNLGGLQYFTFQLKTLNTNQSPLKYQLNSENEYYNRVGYLSFNVQNDIKLIEGKDTLNCVLALFERNYNISPTSTLNLAFEGSKSEQFIDKEFVFNDKIFGNGPIKIKIDKENIKNIPELKI